ncbi:MAG: BolA family transcriptional regulator [Steroidobacteraceae bacterium]|nr:BolA family transcriptional regulator [Steroidobacteraceae bacterium]MDW8258409.1 BolA family protein [Gammaproteobacteria bacterium]
MSVTVESITARVERMRACLQRALEPSELEILDDSAAHVGHPAAVSGAGHYRLRIRSSKFAGLSRIARHRLVYDALAPMLGTDIHALSIDADLPA